MSNKNYLCVGITKGIYSDMQKALKALKQKNNRWGLGRMLNAAVHEFLRDMPDKSDKTLDTLFDLYDAQGKKNG
jgi:transposase